MRRLEREPKPAAPEAAGPTPTALLYVEKLLLIWTRDNSGGVGGVDTVGERLLPLSTSDTNTDSGSAAVVEPPAAGAVLNFDPLPLGPAKRLCNAAMPLPSWRLHMGGSAAASTLSPCAVSFVALVLL